MLLEALTLGKVGVMAETYASQRRYPVELRERAVRMVLEAFEQSGERHGVVTRIARQLVSGRSRCARGCARRRPMAAAGVSC